MTASDISLRQHIADGHSRVDERNKADDASASGRTSMRSFSWDAGKERSNFRKHAVTFAEAQTVFDDDLAQIEDDPDHSVGEHREMIIGYSRQGRLLMVSFVQREETIRLISARRAEARERKRHEEENS
jgi:uncharacterized DUF497 family protein